MPREVGKGLGRETGIARTMRLILMEMGMGSLCRMMGMMMGITSLVVLCPKQKSVCPSSANWNLVE